MTEAGSILGTAQYLAPEQAKGQPVDARTDLYSVGVVLYEMLTGTVPFKGDTAVTVALKHVNEIAVEPAQMIPGLPYSLNQIVLKAMAKDPAQRYQSADQFARDLRAAQVGGPVAAATFDSGAERTSVLRRRGRRRRHGRDDAAAARPVRSDRGRKRRRWPIVLVVVLLLLVIAADRLRARARHGRRLGDACPSVVGQTKAAALTALEEKGFKARSRRSTPTSSPPAWSRARRRRPAPSCARASPSTSG